MCERRCQAAGLAHSPIARVTTVMLSTVVVWALVAGCVRSTGQPADATPTSARATVAVTAVAGSPVSATTPSRLVPTVQASPPPAEPLIAHATADAARQVGVSQDSVRVVRVEPREWPDRSLGCPRPGMGYAQAITPGYLIVVEAGGRELEYHADHAQAVLCTPV